MSFWNKNWASLFSEWFSYDCHYTKAKVITSGQSHQTLIMQRANQNTKPKHTTSAKCGKTCNQCQGQKNMQLVSRAGNMQPVPRAGKQATSAKRDFASKIVFSSTWLVEKANGKQSQQNKKPLAVNGKLLYGEIITYPFFSPPLLLKSPDTIISLFTLYHKNIILIFTPLIFQKYISFHSNEIL